MNSKKYCFECIANVSVEYVKDGIKQVNNPYGHVVCAFAVDWNLGQHVHVQTGLLIAVSDFITLRVYLRHSFYFPPSH